MYNFIRFLLVLSTGLNCLSAVTAMKDNPSEHQGDKTTGIVVRVLEKKKLEEVATAAETNSRPENCTPEMFNHLQKIMEGVGEGSLLGSFKDVGKKGIDSISSANHYILILGALNNGYTAAIGFLNFIRSKNIKPKVTVVLTREFLDDVKGQPPQEGAQKIKMKNRFDPILERIKELVGSNNYTEFQEKENVNPTAEILKRITQTEKTVAIDGLTGSGNDASTVREDREFGVMLVDTLIQDQHVLVIGHDGSSCFGSTIKSLSNKKVQQTDIVFNTTRAQTGQSCEGLVILEDMNAVLKQKQNEAGFNTPYDKAGKIKVALVSPGTDFPYDRLNNPFENVASMTLVFGSINCQIIDYDNKV